MCPQFGGGSDTLHIDNTIIDGGVRFETGEDTTSILSGFSLQNGEVYIGCDTPNVSAQVNDCNFLGNGLKISHQGGGLAPVLIRSCHFVNCGVHIGVESRASISSCKIDGGVGDIDSYASFIAIDSSTIGGSVYGCGQITASTVRGALRAHDCARYASNCTIGRVWVHDAALMTLDSCVIGVVDRTPMDWGSIHGRWCIVNDTIYKHLTTVRFAHSTLLGPVIQQLDKENFLLNKGIRGRSITLDTCILNVWRDSTAGQEMYDNAIVGFSIPWADWSVNAHCCVIYGFRTSWLSGESAIIDTSDVIFLDPLFCDPTSEDYRLDALSPCLPDHQFNPCSSLVGALGVGCSTYPDADSDGITDVQDECTDIDEDGYGNPDFPANTCAEDNCPAVSNPDQLDTDEDGNGDICDICPGHDDNVDTDEDAVPDGCDNCPGFDDALDSDTDGVPDGCDVCEGFDDAIDADEDGVPDGCDVCEGHDDAIDTDEDGVPDGCDICEGFDDAIDTDDDGVPDGCDVCEGYDDSVDTDEDTVPDGCDICPGFADSVDTDIDGVPDGCDICEGFDDAIDTDDDSVPDGCDVCEGYDDNLDIDTDGVPNGCDNCPQNYNPSQQDSDSDSVGNICDLCAGYDDNIDTDTDGVPDGCDICEGYDDSVDTDEDTVPDGCDNCPQDYNTSQHDADLDDVGNVCDNCISTYNPGQENVDGDQFGDVCDTCCVEPSVGDLDQGGGDLGFNYDGADLSAMINGLFINPSTGWNGICLDEADVDFSSPVRPVVDAMTIDGADLSVLIDALFIAPTHFLKNCDGTDNW